MTTLVLGASGATGRLVVKQLIAAGEPVKVVVRSAEEFKAFMEHSPLLNVTVANLLDLSDDELVNQVRDCRAVVSCLGHNLTVKGLFGHPRRLVTEATARLCRAIECTSPQRPVKFILMNTSGNQNKQAGEKRAFKEALVIGLLRLLLPPHVDNEKAAAYLQSMGSHSPFIEWTAVRPDDLVDEEGVTEYCVYESPIRSAIFDAGQTSRINVAHFMSRLILDDSIWSQWKSQMPVIYNV